MLLKLSLSFLFHLTVIETMPRLLFTWELGANYGHLNRLLPLAEHRQALGSDILFAVRDTVAAEQILRPKMIRFLQAPLVSIGPRKIAPVDFSELLLSVGYENRYSLLQAIDTWLRLFDRFAPDLIIVDHSPTALLAAQIMQLPAIQIGNGFEIPPDDHWSSIQPWTEVSQQRMILSQALLLNNLNICLRSYGHQSWEHPRELFHLKAKILASFSELDHYGFRRNQHYAGPIYVDNTGQQADWRDDHRSKIFVYLWPGLPGLNVIMSVLAKMNIDVIAVIPGLESEALSHYQSPNIQIFSTPLKFSNLMSRCDLLISHAAFGTVSAFLQRGIPMLVIPHMAEQYMLSMQIESIGAGIIVGFKRNELTVQSALSRLLGDSDYRETARQFASKYKDFVPRQAVTYSSDLVDNVLKKAF